MPHPILLVPSNHDVGLTSVCIGLVLALERHGVHVGFFKPICQGRKNGKKILADTSTALIRATTHIDPPEPLNADYVEHLLAEGASDTITEEIVAKFQLASMHKDVVVVEGLVPTYEQVYSVRLNAAIANAIDAEVIIIGDMDKTDLEHAIDDHGIVSLAYGSRVIGCILNKIHDNKEEEEAPAVTGILARAGSPDRHKEVFFDLINRLEQACIRPLGLIPFRKSFNAPRVKDVCDQLNARIIREGDIASRRVRGIRIAAASIERSSAVFTHGCLVVTSGDRSDVILGAALATLNGVELAGLVLSGDTEPDHRIMDLCRQAFAAGLPVLSLPGNTYECARSIFNMDYEIPLGDTERAKLVMNSIANFIDSDWILSLASSKRGIRLSPPAFRYQLITQARSNPQRVVLPEGTEPRILSAAAICAKRGIAIPVLLGNAQEIQTACDNNNIALGEGVEIIDIDSNIEPYVAPMVELRKSKGLTAGQARDALHEGTVFGTMMMKLDQVDGMVSGAAHSTANTIRPALQLIKTAPGCSLVSSVFFMCLPHQVLVFGDCAVNPNPTAEQLADIAIQSAASAKAFGIPARVAMISYSTGDSGAGVDVQKVVDATALVRQRAPELLVDGPLQYDAATVPSVGEQKASGSPVAGNATVIIFPDLNTGNTTYKAVQRSADVLSIGPMLQGLAKPVNDLSRGATVEDIVFTIALTVIQAQVAKGGGR